MSVKMALRASLSRRYAARMQPRDLRARMRPKALWARRRPGVLTAMHLRVIAAGRVVIAAALICLPVWR